MALDLIFYSLTKEKKEQIVEERKEGRKERKTRAPFSDQSKAKGSIECLSIYF